ncbi:MAG: Fe-S cluster assembly protein SufD [Candidatus Omnitrophica bacterium]|nr:Fe-S cluster assembly protein SufD [Candidatus Omnitrophota bacterium]MDE2009358.1 Fe-S cluster assembly protein SufD [Candidatus Omnitrophota bacterium]
MMTQQQMPLNIEGLQEYQSKLSGNSNGWLKTFRQKSFDQWSAEPMPTPKDEEWKYTSLADVINRRFQLARRHQLVEDRQFENYRSRADINVVLVNGVLWGELSNLKDLPPGLKISSFNEALGHGSDEIRDTVSKLTPNDSKPFLWMNQALFLDGAFIRVMPEAEIGPLVHIIHVTSGILPDTVVFPRTFISVGESASVDILESHISFEPVSYLSNAVTDIRIAANAMVGFCKTQAEAHQAVHVGTTRIWQEAASYLDSFSFNFGGRLVRNNLSVLIKGEATRTVMNGLYGIDGNQHVDNHTLLDIQHPNCTSYQLYKGLLNGKSRAVFNGKIYVHAQAQKTDAYQLNKHLLLGKEARVDTKPQLEIFADDVKCTHGATIGQLNEEEIFYLQSRCIPRPTAIQLMSKGFIDDIINTIKSDSIRAKLGRLLLKKFPEIKL